MSISKNMSFFCLGAAVGFCTLTVALVSLMNGVIHGYDQLLNSHVRQVEEARVIQVDFKKQVQEWKDILLRGNNRGDLATYTKQFHSREAQVRAEAVALSGKIDDPEAKYTVDQFLSAHQLLSQKYAQAYDVYVAGNGDFKGADRIVRGQDREPTDLFDSAVKRLDTVVENSVEAHRRAVLRRRRLALGAGAGLLLLLGVAALLIVRVYERDHEELCRTHRELQKAMDELRVLRGFLCTCAWCKRIRQDDSKWVPMETYIQEHTHALFTHGVCPECAKLLLKDGRAPTNQPMVAPHLTICSCAPQSAMLR